MNISVDETGHIELSEVYESIVIDTDYGKVSLAHRDGRLEAAWGERGEYLTIPPLDVTGEEFNLLMRLKKFARHRRQIALDETDSSSPAAMVQATIGRRAEVEEFLRWTERELNRDGEAIT